MQKNQLKEFVEAVGFIVPPTFLMQMEHIN